MIWTIRYTDNLGAGAGERLHDWRIIHIRSLSQCCGVDQNNSGTKTSVEGLRVLSCRSYLLTLQLDDCTLKTGGVK
jgi:hypothetical protein